MRWPWSKPAPPPVVLSQVEKAVIANSLGVSTRAVGEVQKIKQRATNNGLMACLNAETKARIDAAFYLAEKALSASQSHPVPGRHRAARNLKLSTHGGAK